MKRSKLIEVLQGLQKQFEEMVGHWEKQAPDQVAFSKMKLEESKERALAMKLTIKELKK